jgi:hypothetical protein
MLYSERRISCLHFTAYPTIPCLCPLASLIKPCHHHRKYVRLLRNISVFKDRRHLKRLSKIYLHKSLVTSEAKMRRPYMLYHHPSSVCSLMVRYTWALRGAPRSPSMEMEMDEQMIDIFHTAQLEENFLCEINPQGQVRQHYTPKISALSITYNENDPQRLRLLRHRYQF